jgi:acyl-ACP thioesterase
MHKRSEVLTVLSSESDSNKNLKVFSFLTKTQEIANNHANTLGFGYDKLIQSHSAWVLSRLKGKFINTPKWQDRYTLSTWHKGMSGLFSIRDFVATPENQPDTPSILCTSSWLIMDLNTRRLLRAEHVLGDDIFTTAHHEDAIEEPCGKLIFPKDMEKVSSRNVVLSDIDMNHHTNNAKYIEWAFDVIPTEYTLHREVDEFQINFNKESKIGETIDFYSAQKDENTFMIEGKRDNESIFQTLIKFK